MPRSAQPTTPKRSTASPPATTRAGARTLAATARPSSANPTYTAPRFRYAQDRSGAIDQIIVTPFQQTNAARSPNATSPARPGTATGTSPARPAARNPKPTATAKMPIQNSLLSLRLPPKKSETVTSTAAAESGRRPTAVRIELAR